MRDAAIETRRSVPRGGRAAIKARPRGARWPQVDAALRAFRRNPARMLGLVGGVVMAGTIVGNAMLLQSGRHPAPLFGSLLPLSRSGVPLPAPPMPAPRPSSPVAAAPEADARPPERQALTEAPAPPPATAPPKSTEHEGVHRSAHRDAPPVHLSGPKPAQVHRPDGIAQLLRGGGTTPAKSAGNVSHIAAERSLAKIGLTVKPDGRMGSIDRPDHHVANGAGPSPRPSHDASGAVGLSGH